ncbi:MAG: class I SAM-dependent methyltransferase, partial [Tepidisphaeraceae bacterium]
MEGRGFRRTHRVIGEFTEIQRRTKGWVRRILLRLNNLAYRLKLPARAAVTQLLVFEKSN